MNSEKGFTLIELLAVIVILALIALVSTPIILNLIDNVRIEAVKSNAYGIADAAEYQFIQKSLTGGLHYDLTFTYKDGLLATDESEITLEYKGERPKEGIIIANQGGMVSLAIHNGKHCATKGYDDLEVSVEVKSEEACLLPLKTIIKEIAESNANQLLQAMATKKAGDPDFDLTTIDETNVTTILRVPLLNYKSLKVSMENNEPYIVLNGQNNWNDLVISGTKNNLLVHEGLVLWLDAGNLDSYAGTGNTWYDLSENGNNATINGNSNNPIWNSNGYWNFPATAIGLNGGMIIPNSTSLSSVGVATVELVFTLESKTLVSGDTIWMNILSKGSTQTPGVSTNPSTGNKYLHIEKPDLFNSASNLLTDYTGNQWYYITAVLSSTSYGYINGLQVSSSPGGMTANNFPIYIGYDSDNEMFKGKLAMVRMYNRALSSEEIQQNFNVLRGDFGI